MVSVLGATTAYPEPLSLGSVPIAVQTIQRAGVFNYAEQLIAEHERGEWYIHCGRYVAQQGGCVTCYLHKVGVVDFCPWHQEDDPDYYRSNHQILHLAGKIQPSGEINVMGYMDEFPLQCQLLFFSCHL